MDIVRTIADLRRHISVWRKAGERVGLVLTMGALHEGHLALVRAARSECDHVVATIFVNPTQFDANEDLASYPRREEAEKRGKLIKAASERHAPPAEACKLIGNFAQVETKMLKYVEVHTARCGIPPQISEQLRNGHKATEAMQQKVCSVAQQLQKQGPSGPSLSDVLGSATALPEVAASKKGGGTFDTLNGNALTR